MRSCLYHAGNLVYTQCYLFDSACLVFGCICNLIYLGGSCADFFHYLHQRLSGRICNFRTAGHSLDRTFNQLCCILGSRRTLAGQITNLICHNCKAFSCNSGTGRLHSSIKCQYIGLKSNIFNGFDNLTDFIGSTGNFFHGIHHILHLIIAYFHFITGST